MPATRPAPRALGLAGPTASGKTDLALALAERLPIEVISVDSAMVYRGMDIGTAKPAPAVRAATRHHLIDIRDPWESFSAGEFVAEAGRLIGEIRARGRVPVLAGGTLLYFRALRAGLATLPAADPALRAELDSQAERLGWAALHRRLAEIDPATAARVAPADRHRIQRALEVFMLSGEPLSALLARHRSADCTGLFLVGLLPADRALLYERIEQRLDAMLAAGFVAEVERLRALPGMHAQRPAARAVGYRQIWACLEGRWDIDEARRRAVVATRRYAKRQLTWLRAEPLDLALEPATTGLADALVAALRGQGLA